MDDQGEDTHPRWVPAVSSKTVGDFANLAQHFVIEGTGNEFKQ